jgi:transmembrane sensor
MNPQRPLSEFVKPAEVSSAALHLEWHEVRRRVKRRKQMRVGLTVVALLMAGLFAGLVLRPSSTEPFTPGQNVLTQDTARTLKLAEGSKVMVADNSGIALQSADAKEVLLVLDHGRALFDVEKNPGRRFIVKADGVEVRVIGTRFTVQREGTKVSVNVERGIVEVRDGETVQRLEKGASWTRTPVVVGAVEDEPVEEEVAEEEVVEPNTPTRSTPVKKKRPVRTGGKKKLVAAKEADEPPAITAPVAEEDEPLAKPPESPLPNQMKPVEPTAAEMFAAAMRARSDGKPKEAIVGFQQVCERWPSSAYAPMSAFEWGRLALDTQGDPRQAARAFERTLELATSASLIEDALARLTEAYARFDVGSCRRVQAEYLKRFPDGPHVRAVTKACPN